MRVCIQICSHIPQQSDLKYKYQKYEFNFNYLPLVFDWMNYHTDSKYRAGAS